MRSKLIYFSILLLILSSCSKGKDKIVPISSFSFGGDTISILKMGTNDESIVISNSKYSSSILWDFGDGRSSTEKEILLSYPKSGTYTLKLISKNNDGESVSAKKVIVLDRVLKRIMINCVQWDSTNLTEPWPRCYKVDLYFQMQLFTDNSRNLNGFYYNCPVIYTSPVVKNISNHSYPPLYAPIEIPVTEKVIIEKKLVQFAPNNLNKAYLFSVMAKDIDGNIYRLINNAFYGYSFGISEDDIKLNTFVVEGYGPTTYELICDFE